MFIYSMRAGTLKLIGVVCVALTVLITLIAFVPTYSAGNAAVNASGAAEIDYDGIKSADDVASFLTQFGWQTDGEPEEVATVTVPEEFDKVFAAYNELQKEQGLSLTRYRGKSVTRYTFRITNYSGYEGKVLANVLVYRNRVVGGDVCSTDATGFVHGFTPRDGAMTETAEE